LQLIFPVCHLFLPGGDPFPLKRRRSKDREQAKAASGGRQSVASSQQSDGSKFENENEDEEDFRRRETGNEGMQLPSGAGVSFSERKT